MLSKLSCYSVRRKIYCQSQGTENDIPDAGLLNMVFTDETGHYIPVSHVKWSLHRTEHFNSKTLNVVYQNKFLV